MKAEQTHSDAIGRLDKVNSWLQAHDSWPGSPSTPKMDQSGFVLCAEQEKLEQVRVVCSTPSLALTLKVWPELPLHTCSPLWNIKSRRNWWHRHYKRNNQDLHFTVTHCGNTQLILLLNTFDSWSIAHEWSAVCQRKWNWWVSIES